MDSLILSLRIFSCKEVPKLTKTTVPTEAETAVREKGQFSYPRSVLRRDYHIKLMYFMVFTDNSLDRNPVKEEVAVGVV